jgi:hypothetical protein
MSRQTEQEEGQVVRVPFGAHRSKLQLSEKDSKILEKRGFVLRWFNDQDGRIERAQAGGYTFVEPKEVPSLGFGAIHQGNSDAGSKVSKVVSKGEPIIRAYLMKIQKEYYEADQKEKAKQVDKVDEALRRGNAGGTNVENAYGPGVTYSR